MATILANPVMIDAYAAGIPDNGRPFPGGSKMAKIPWTPKKMETLPAATVPGTLHDVDFMVKDSTRFTDSTASAGGPAAGIERPKEVLGDPAVHRALQRRRLEGPLVHH